MEPDSVEQYLVHILTPVYRIVEDDSIKDSQMGEWGNPILENIS